MHLIYQSTNKFTIIMKTISLAIVAVMLLISCSKETKIVQKKIKQYSIQQFMDNESVFGGSFSPDNSKLLVSSNKSGIYNMYTIPSTGGTYTTITASDSSSIFAISYFPNDERMLYRADGNGDEIFHIYLRDIDGTITELTPDKGARAGFYGWSHDEKSFYFGSNKRNPRYMDLYEMDITSFTSKLVYQNNDGLNVVAISNDKNTLSLSKSVNTNDADLFLYNIKTQKMTQLNDTQCGNAAQDFSLDGENFYYTTDNGAEFSYLMKYTIATQEKEKILEKSWDISASFFTTHGTYSITYINEDAKNVIEVKNLATDKNIVLPNFEGSSITNVSFSRDETMMRLYVGGSDRPSNLFSYNLK